VKKLLILITSLLLISPLYARGGGGYRSSYRYSSRSYSSGTGSSHYSTYVHGYTRRNGRYVAPYHRTVRNHTRRDNYSTKGNYNPWTGKWGTKKGY
jgi:hypothetical protein